MGTAMSKRTGDSPAGRAMDEAIEMAVEGRSPYPDKATFIDADTPTVYIDRESRRAAEEGQAVVLVAADGSTRILHPEPTAPR
jgi:hypothetical protein